MMKISKTFLNDILNEERYEDMLENHLHTGTHYSMVFLKDDKLYKAHFIEGMNGPRWLSPNPKSTEAECTEVKRTEETRVVVGYKDIDDSPVSTPQSLDYYV